MCEGCHAKHANSGRRVERKERWCSGCGEAHGAVRLGKKMCEGCHAKQAHYGTPAERKARWCSGCGEAHGAVRLGARKVCEDCHAKLAHCGTPYSSQSLLGILRRVANENCASTMGMSFRRYPSICTNVPILRRRLAIVRIL